MHPIYRTGAPLLSAESFLCIYLTNIFNYIFLIPAVQSPFMPPQNSVHFIMLNFLVHEIFTFYKNVVLKFQCPAPGPKG